MKSLLPKVCLSNSISVVILDNFYILANVFFEWVDIRHSCAGMFPCKEGDIKVLASLDLSSQRIGSLLRTSLAVEAGQKNLANSEFGKFASMEKYT
jgi:hypothetical protein